MLRLIAASQQLRSHGAVPLAGKLLGGQRPLRGGDNSMKA